MSSNVQIAISALLFVVAVVGIVVQARVLHEAAALGISTTQTRVVIAGYALVAIYAAVSIVARLRTGTLKR